MLPIVRFLDDSVVMRAFHQQGHEVELGFPIAVLKQALDDIVGVLTLSQYNQPESM